MRSRRRRAAAPRYAASAPRRFRSRPAASGPLTSCSTAGSPTMQACSPPPRAHGGYACPAGPHDITTPAGHTLRELPMSTMSVLGKTLAFSGGGFLRVLPWWMIERGMRQCAARGVPAVVYLHPWDFAVDCPVPPMSRWHRFKCYHGRSRRGGQADQAARGLAVADVFAGIGTGGSRVRVSGAAIIGVFHRGKECFHATTTCVCFIALLCRAARSRVGKCPSAGRG